MCSQSLILAEGFAGNTHTEEYYIPRIFTRFKSGFVHFYMYKSTPLSRMNLV